MGKAIQLVMIVLVTTYNRPRMLRRMLKRLKREAKGYNVRVKVYDDGSTRCYKRTKKYLKKTFPDSEFRELSHHGKQEFYALHGIMYSELIREDFDYLFQIPDDMFPVRGFFEKAIKGLKDSGGDVLNPVIKPKLSRLWDKEGQPYVVVDGTKYWRVPWFECFVATKNFMEIMDHTCPEPEMQHRYDPQKSSGVGSAMSITFNNRGGKIRVVDNSLLTHKGNKSMMRRDKPIRRMKQ